MSDIFSCVIITIVVLVLTLGLLGVATDYSSDSTRWQQINKEQEEIITKLNNTLNTTQESFDSMIVTNNQLVATIYSYKTTVEAQEKTIRKYESMLTAQRDLNVSLVKTIPGWNGVVEQLFNENLALKAQIQNEKPSNNQTNQ